MMRLSSWLIGILAIGSAVFSVQPAQADTVDIGILGQRSHFSDEITSTGPTYSRDYSFFLDSSSFNKGMTILATGFGQTHPAFGITSVTVNLLDAANTLLATATGATLASLDSFTQIGTGLFSDRYLLSIFGDVAPGKDAFVSVSIAVNRASAVPLPGAILLMLTGLGALGGLALRHGRSGGLDR
jgi:hypothetical protein